MKCDDCGGQAGALFTCEDGSHWHYECYRGAMIAAGEPDPFPNCDGCKTSIIDGIVIERNKVYEHGEWRPATWHPDCCPVDAPTQPDSLPTGGPASGCEGSPGELEPGAEVPGVPVESTEASDSDAAGEHPVCLGCSYPVKRKAVDVPGYGPSHPSCAKLLAKRAFKKGPNRKTYTAAVRNEASKKSQARARQVKRNVASEKIKAVKQDCIKCYQPIRTAREGVECDDEQGNKEYWHKRCYREAWKEAGFNDPFAPEAEFPCSICQPPSMIPRSQFVQHVSQHEVDILTQESQR